MKSYTDIEQSHKLAEILPLKSADYHYIAQGEKSYFYSYSLSSDAVKDYDEEIKYIPCWSLAALLGVLPTYHLEIVCGEYYKIYPELFDENHSHIRGIFGTGSNLIDACYDMIIHLHELNLL